MKKFFRTISLFLIIIMLTNTISFADVDISQNIKGALLGDLEKGEVLYQYNTNEQLAIASITKLMTYLLMMDAVSENKVSLDDEVLISGHAAMTEGSRFGLVAGEKVKLSILVKGMLIVSGNDCATAIAEYVGGTEDNFVKMMNEKAAELGLLSASYINPHGLPINDEETGQNHMSVADLYKLVRYLLKTYPEVLEVTKQKELVISERNFSKVATNPILPVIEGTDGLKTGYTDKAGLCLISTMPVTGQGQDFRLIAIVMGAQTHDDRLIKTKQLLEYGLNNFSSRKLTDKEQIIDQVYISNSKDGKVDVCPSENFSKLVKNDETVKTKITYNDSVSAPLNKGEKIGTITMYINDKEVGQVDAVVTKNIEKANIFVRLLRFIKNIFTL